MKKIFTTLASAALLFCGCTVSELIDEQTEDHVFTASFEERSETKTYIDSDLYLYWTADDRLSIFTSTLNEQYLFKGETGDNSGSFEKISSGEFVTGNTISTNYAVYPYSPSTAMTKNEKITLELPADQKYAEGSFGVGANTMVAVTSGKSDYFLPFKNLCGYLVVKLYGEGAVKSISIKGNNGEKLAGPATVTASNGSAPSLECGSAATETITIDCGEGVVLGADETHATEFWFCIPPVTFEKGFTITATNTEGRSMVKTTSSIRTLDRNIKYSMPALEAAFDIYSDKVVFEDANFKAYCVAIFDTNNDGEISLSEAEQAANIDCSSKGIKSLKGIECFTSLTSLHCEYNQLTNLDVSKNTLLTELYCKGNQLSSLKVTNCTVLQTLWCQSNQLEYLDVSDCKSLKDFRFDGNQFENIDLSNNKSLSMLICWLNQLTNLDVSECVSLNYLECWGNKLTSLNVSNNTVLTFLQCYSNQLTSLDVSGCMSLEILDCTENPLSELWLREGQTIKELYYDPEMTMLKYKPYPSVEYIDLGLSVKWASCNLGANKPEEYGKYFAWGDVVGQTWNGSEWSGSGFSTSPDYELDSNNNLKPEYDAAHVNLGGNWRMPTNAEFEELINKCTTTWTTDYNGTGVSGRIFTSRKKGYTDKFIFLPAAGYGSNSPLLSAGSSGCYWSSTFFSDGSRAWLLDFYSGDVNSLYYSRSGGQSVRPVSE